MRQVAQESVLLRLQIGEPLAQPFEPLAEVAQILRAADADRLREVRAAQQADRAVELGDRPRDETRERERRNQRQRDGDEHQRQQLPLHVLGACAQPLDLPVGDPRADGEHLVRAFGELARARAHLGDIGRGLGGGEHLVQTLLARHRAIERGQLLVAERQSRELRGELAEAVVQALVVLQQPGIGQHRDLLRQALDRGDAIDQRAAAARGLRRVVHRAAALLRQALRTERGVQQRARQRQGDEQKAGDEQPEEGTRIPQGRPRRADLGSHVSIIARQTMSGRALCHTPGCRA